MNRFAWLGLVVLAVAALWVAGWFYAASEVRARIAALAPDLACAELDISGFPFRLDVECSGLSHGTGDLGIGLAGVKASVLVYNPTHVILSAAGPLTIADAFTGSQSRVDFAAAEASIRLKAADFWAGLRGEGWRLARASLLADGIAWIDTLTGEALLASADHLEGHLLDIPEQHQPENGLAALASYASLDGLTAPGLVITDAVASLEAELTGLPDDLRALAVPDALQRWRDAGGSLELIRLEGTAGEEFVRASGTLSLDAAGHPEGQLALSSKGLAERAGALIPPEWQGVILGSPAADGSYSQTVNLRGGYIFAGLMPLGQLQPLF